MNYIEKLTDSDIENLLQKSNLKPINIMRDFTKDKEPFAIIYCEKIKKSSVDKLIENQFGQFYNLLNLDNNKYNFGKNVLFLTNFTLSDNFHEIDYSIELYNFIMDESNFDSKTKKQYTKDFIAYYGNEINNKKENEETK